MVQLTRDVLEQLGADHGPQREGDPLGKATIERAFGTVKSIARPLLAITDKLAEAVEALRNASIRPWRSWTAKPSSVQPRCNAGATTPRSSSTSWPQQVPQPIVLIALRVISSEKPGHQRARTPRRPCGLRRQEVGDQHKSTFLH